MSPESRIWEIRPFGSMRGGRESVIGLVPFNPTSPAYSTKPAPKIIFLKPAMRNQNFPLERVKGIEPTTFLPRLA